MMNAICPSCGKTFRKRRASIKYCSVKCGRAWAIKRSMIECCECGKIFERNDCHIKEHNFCSRGCYRQWHKKNMVAENAPHWKGGVYHTQSGYLYIRQEDGKYKAEHRSIVEEMLGRKLTCDEVVHHLDENKQNNSIENLVVMDREEHAKLHHTKGSEIDG